MNSRSTRLLAHPRSVAAPLGFRSAGFLLLFFLPGSATEGEPVARAQPVVADVAAAWTGDHQALTVAVINPTESEQQLDLRVRGAELAGTGTQWRMAPSSLDATIVVGERPGVQVEERVLDAVPATPTFAPFSVTIYRFPVR